MLEYFFSFLPTVFVEHWSLYCMMFIKRGMMVKIVDLWGICASILANTDDNLLASVTAIHFCSSCLLWHVVFFWVGFFYLLIACSRNCISPISLAAVERMHPELLITNRTHWFLMDFNLVKTVSLSLFHCTLSSGLPWTWAPVAETIRASPLFRQLTALR